MSEVLLFLLALCAWVGVCLLVSRAMHINGEEVDAQCAVDSIRAELGVDEPPRPHVKAITEPRK